MILKIEERRARLYGLDKPTKTKIDLGVDKMTPAEMIEEARRLGLPIPKELTEGHVDVQPPSDSP